jgi:wobble nucleotide-excising tRNase
VLDRIQLLRNVGQFDSVSAGAQLPLAKLSLIYAENGRGKTTLAAILRSLGTGNAALVNERHRLGATHPPHVAIREDGGAPIIFQNGQWSRTLPDIAVFDDSFVAANVCSGVDIEAGHRQNLHELILGAQGVALNAAVQVHVAAVEEHNRRLRSLADAIPSAARGTLSVEAFCSLEARNDIESALQDADRKVAAGRAAAAVRTRPGFTPLALPAFDLPAIAVTLSSDLPELENTAAARVQAHLDRLGDGGEDWVADGVTRATRLSADASCPFCAQDLAASTLITHYRAYFGEAYGALKQAVSTQFQAINAAHGGDIPAAFERAVRIAVESREFWRSFAEVPEIALDTAEVARAWIAARVF